MKRELTETEIGFINKRLGPLNDELAGIEQVDIAKTQLAIDTADIELKRQLNVLKHKVKSFQAEADTIRGTIDVLHDQIENGVEVKEEEKEVN